MYSKNNIINNSVIFKGVIVGLVILFVFSLVVALISRVLMGFMLLYFNNLLILTNLLIIILIGFYIARRVKYNGWLNGALGGLIFMVIILLFGSMNMHLSINSILIVLIFGILGGTIGGIVGINF